MVDIGEGFQVCKFMPGMWMVRYKDTLLGYIEKPTLKEAKRLYRKIILEVIL